MLTAISRVVILTIAKVNCKRGIIAYNTIIIGGNQRAVNLYKEITHYKKSLGYSFQGFVDMNGESDSELINFIPKLGKIQQLEEILNERNVDEVIIAIESYDHHQLNHIMNIVSSQNDVVVKIIPDMYDIMAGSVK